MGADIRPRTKVTRVEPEGQGWTVNLEDSTGRREIITARAIVNAAGPWVDEVLKTVFGRNDMHNVRLVRGSHIVVPRLFDEDRCYVLQNADGRVVFVIPFEQDFTLIGTTDVDHADIHDRPKITDDEIAYLCDMASTYFREPITREEIVWTYSAVRPLYDDGSSDAQEATRDYVIEAEVAEGQGLLLNVFGGKITTYRRLAEAALEKIEAALGQRKPAWTARASLPGGDFPIEGYGALLEDCRRAYPFLTAKHLDRLLGLYGTDIHRMLEGKRSIAELGVHFGCGLYETEIQYLEKVEWAKTAEDILFRRTKLGLHLTPAEIEAVELRFANAGQAAKTSTA